MSVLLCRSDGKPFPTPPPLELRGLPRIVIDYEPLPEHSSYQGKQIATRTESHYACLDQPREEFFKETYDRRHEQLTEGGFHTPNTKPYKEVGDVQLDDTKLILGALGQLQNENDQRLSHRSKGKKVRVKSEPQPASLMSPYRVKLHSKTPSQFPMELLTLNDKVSHGQAQLEQMQKGNRLYSLLQEDKMKKKLEEEAKQHHDQDARFKHWKEAEVATDVKLTFENGHLEPEVKARDRSSDSRKRGSMSAISNLRRRSIVEPHHRMSIVETDATSASSEHRTSFSRGSEGCSESRRADSVEDDRRDSESSRIGSAAINPIYLWYRKLCVMVWILEAMQLENPLHAIPLARCWDINRRYPDEPTNRRRYDRQRYELERYRREFTTPRRSIFKSKVASYMGFRRIVSGSPTKKTMSTSSKDESLDQYAASTQHSRIFNQMEEERMKKQKKLSPTQMEHLVNMLDEELNYSLKQSRSRINALIRESGYDKKKKSTMKKWSFQAPTVTLDLDDLKQQFTDADEERRMIIHEQLTAMERDREEALRQRLGALHVSGNLWKDLATMRKGVKIESTEMARQKLLMNFHWYEELLLSLPKEVKADRYCHQLLDALSILADDMYAVGPTKMSRKKLIQVLSVMKPFELQAPDIKAAIEYLMQHVVYVAREDYEKWLEQHVAVYRFNSKLTKAPSDVDSTK